MPPKRRQPTSASTSAPLPSREKQARPSRLAKEHDLSAAQEAEIREAFCLFVRPSSAGSEPLIPTPSLRRALVALSLPPSDPAELASLVDAADPDASGLVDYPTFVGIAALKLHAKEDGEGDDDEARRDEVRRAFELFTGGKGEVITLAHLKRVARDLKMDDETGEAVLRDMMREANGGGRGVGMMDFEAVMRRAGVFR